MAGYLLDRPHISQEECLTNKATIKRYWRLFNTESTVGEQPDHEPGPETGPQLCCLQLRASPWMRHVVSQDLSTFACPHVQNADSNK